MRIKRGIIASLGMILTLAGIAGAKSDNPQRPDVWRLEHRPVNARVRGQTSTETVSIDHDGDFLPGRNNAQNIGESTHSWLTGYFGNLEVSSGICNVHETFLAIKSSISLVDITSTGTLIISTGTLILSASTYYDHDIRQSTQCPRNVVLYATSTIAGISTTTFAGSATFYGIDNKGNAVQEIIFFSTATPFGGSNSSTQTVTLSTQPLQYLGIGNVAWSYISSFTIQCTSFSQTMNNTTMGITLLWGNKIGLANNILSSSDVYKIVESGQDATDSVNTLPAPVINTVFDTIVFSNVPPTTGVGGSRDVWYKLKRMWP